MKTLKDFFKYHNEDYAYYFFATAMLAGTNWNPLPNAAEIMAFLIALGFLVRGPRTPVKVERKPYSLLLKTGMIWMMALVFIAVMKGIFMTEFMHNYVLSHVGINL